MLSKPVFIQQNTVWAIALHVNLRNEFMPNEYEYFENIQPEGMQTIPSESKINKGVK